MAPGRRREAGVALGIAMGLVSACAVERLTAVELTDAAADATGDDSTLDDSSGDGGADGTPVASSCTAPTSMTSLPDGQLTEGDYFIRNNEWDTAAGPGLQT